MQRLEEHIYKSWRYLFSEANNIDSLKTDGYLTDLRGVYIYLRSKNIGQHNMKRISVSV